MFGLHPLLDVAISPISWVFVEIDLIVSIKVVSEVLKKSHLLLELSFGRILAHFIRGDRVSFVSCFFLDVLEVLAIFVNNDFGWVIEIDTCWAVWKEITQPIFCWVVNPLLDMNLWMDDSLIFLVWAWIRFVREMFVACLFVIFWWTSEVSTTWGKIFGFRRFFYRRFKV